MVVGESDGTFDQNDYILFYGRGSQFRDIDSTGKTIKRFNHPFADKNYFFITAGGENGKRVQNKSSLNTTDDYVQTSTIAFVDYEVDKINLGKSGRQYFGDDYSQTVPSRTYMNKLDYRISAYPVNYKFRFVNASQNSISLGANTFKAALFPSTWTPDIDADEDWADKSADECVGTNYPAGGVTMTGIAITRDDVNDQLEIDADDPRYEDVTIGDINWGVIYKDALADADKKLVVALDLGAQSVMAVPFVVVFPGDGFLVMKQGS